MSDDTRNEFGQETDQRPWGSFTVLDDEATFKVKRIEVLPGKRLSYQRHARRSEHWFIVHGTAIVTLDGERREVSSGDAVDIPVGTDHRIENAADLTATAFNPHRGGAIMDGALVD